MRLRLEFTTEPFDLDEPPAHAVVAREVVENGTLDAVDVGPFGNTAEGAAEVVIDAVGELLRRTLAAGATRISLQVNALGDTSGDTSGGASSDTSSETSGGTSAGTSPRTSPEADR